MGGQGTCEAAGAWDAGAGDSVLTSAAVGSHRVGGPAMLSPLAKQVCLQSRCPSWHLLASSLAFRTCESEGMARCHLNPCVTAEPALQQVHLKSEKRNE